MIVFEIRSHDDRSSDSPVLGVLELVVLVDAWIVGAEMEESSLSLGVSSALTMVIGVALSGWNWS